MLQLTALLALALSCGPKTTPGTAEAATDYFPLVDGSSWTYSGSYNGRTSLETRVTESISVGGEEVWVFYEEGELDNDGVAMVFTGHIGLGAYRAAGRGVETADLSWHSEAGTLDRSTFQPMLTLPPVVGESVKPNTPSPDRSGGWTMLGLESVTVPAGSFTECAHIGLGQGSEAWLCPGVGLVKWVFVTGRVEELTAWEIPGVSKG